jgi:general secretion pathway protein G
MAASKRIIGRMLIAIAVLLLASAVAILSSLTSFGKARHNAELGQLSTIKASLNQYKSITGHYPTTEQGLAALVAQQLEPVSMYGGRTVLDFVPKDLWGSDYIYFCPGRVHPESYDLYSPGPDRIPGTSDDDWGR